MDELAVHGEWSDADIDGAAEVSFLLGADVRLPVVDIGIPDADS